MGQELFLKSFKEKIRTINTVIMSYVIMTLSRLKSQYKKIPPPHW